MNLPSLPITNPYQPGYFHEPLLPSVHPPFGSSPDLSIHGFNDFRFEPLYRLDTLGNVFLSDDRRLSRPIGSVDIEGTINLTEK